MLIDLESKNITGKQAENALVQADITVNKNMVPFDSRSPFVTSGMRFGTAAVTTRGMKEDSMEVIADLVDSVIVDFENESKIASVRKEVNKLMSQYPLYS